MLCAPSHSAPDSVLGGEVAAPRLNNPITLGDNYHASLVTATGQFLMAAHSQTKKRRKDRVRDGHANC